MANIPLPPSFVTSSPPGSDDESVGSEGEIESSDDDLGFGKLNLDVMSSSSESANEEDDIGIASGEEVSEAEEEGFASDDDDEPRLTPTGNIRPVMPSLVLLSPTSVKPTPVASTTQSFMNPPLPNPKLTIPVQLPPIPIPTGPPKPVMKISQDVARPPNLTYAPPLPIVSNPLPPKPQLKMTVLQPTKTSFTAEEATKASTEASVVIPPTAKTLDEMLVKGQSESINFFVLRSNLSKQIAALGGLQPAIAVSLGYMLANKMQFGVKYSDTTENTLTNIATGLASVRS